jgi:hypothetical protein
MQIRFRAAPWTAIVELSLVRLCPVVRYEVRAKAVEGWFEAGGLALVMARYSYVFIHSCGDGGGVVGFLESLGRRYFFRWMMMRLEARVGGFGRGLMRVVQCELLEGLVAWVWV